MSEHAEWDAPAMRLAPREPAANEPNASPLTPEQREFMRRPQYAKLWVRVAREQSAEDVEWGAVESALRMASHSGNLARIVRLPNRADTHTAPMNDAGDDACAVSPETMRI